MAVSFASHGAILDVGTPTTLFRIPAIVQITAGSHNMYKPDFDGKRFLVAVKSDATKVPPISLIMNWPQLLTEK